jgi:hypothetical protein
LTTSDSSAARGAAPSSAAVPGVSTPLFHDKNTQHTGKSQSRRPHTMWKRLLTGQRLSPHARRARWPPPPPPHTPTPSNRPIRGRGSPGEPGIRASTSTIHPDINRQGSRRGRGHAPWRPSPLPCTHTEAPSAVTPAVDNVIYYLPLSVAPGSPPPSPSHQPPAPALAINTPRPAASRTASCQLPHALRRQRTAQRGRAVAPTEGGQRARTEQPSSRGAVAGFSRARASDRAFLARADETTR